MLLYLINWQIVRDVQNTKGANYRNAGKITTAMKSARQRTRYIDFIVELSPFIFAKPLKKLYNNIQPDKIK